MVFDIDAESLYTVPKEGGGAWMRGKWLWVVLALCLLPGFSHAQEKRSASFFGTFDTIVTLVAYTDTQEEFDHCLSIVQDEMTRLNRVFDAYHTYDGISNLCLVNQQAGQEEVSAEKELIALLLRVREWRSLYSTAVNPAMGQVLSLWHEAREAKALPDASALREASSHCGYEDLLIDERAGTIAFADSQLKLDVGAVAKGYAAQLTAEKLRENGYDSFILNAGGNVVCGSAADGRDCWNIAVEAADGVSTLGIVGVSNLAVVTSGDYQRYFTLNGTRYHHLIDPVTLYPARYMHAVTILHADSGLADFLSTAAFLCPYEESRALIDSIPGAEACWTLMDGQVKMTDGFQKLLLQ